MTADEVRARLHAGARRLAMPPALPGGHVRPSQVARIFHDGDEALPARPAAVLVPLLPRDETVLLTRRASHLARHAGQVSFPGGRIDAADADPEAAALREAEEEIGLDRRFVEVVGRLPEIVTGTGYHVVPVIGLVRPGYRLAPAAAEVESIFSLPFATLLDRGAPERRRVEARGRLRETWVWPHPEQYIWGATATILVTLAERLAA